MSQISHTLLHMSKPRKTKKQIVEETLASMKEIDMWGELSNAPGNYEINFKARGGSNFFIKLSDVKFDKKQYDPEVQKNHRQLAIYNAIYIDLERERERMESYIDKQSNRYFTEN